MQTESKWGHTVLNYPIQKLNIADIEKNKNKTKNNTNKKVQFIITI